MAGVETLYKNFGILADASENAGDHLEAYQSFIDATKASLPEKKLACQFIPRFFHFFPSLADDAIDAQLDLCEEEETQLRCQAIKSITDFCKDGSNHIIRISDVLTQLLQQEDPSEAEIIHNGIELLLERDAEATLQGMFHQITHGVDLAREKAIAYLNHYTSSEKLKDEEVFGVCLINEIGKILNDVTGEEFKTLIAILKNVKSTGTSPQKLLDLITEQAGLDNPFLPMEQEVVDRIVTCSQLAMPLFMKGVSPKNFVEYLFKEVLPVFEDIIETGKGDYKYRLLMLIAELSPYASEDDAKAFFESVYINLVTFLPSPLDTSSELDEETLEKLNFSFVECLLYVIHKLGSKNNDYLISDENADVLKDFHLRIQYFGRMTQVYIKQIKTALQELHPNELESVAENKLKLVALSTCKNITVMVRDLLHNPPSFRSRIVLSWKSRNAPMTLSESVEERRKRSGITPISLDNLPSKRDPNYMPYTTPIRKGSQSDMYSNRNRGGYGNRRGNRGNNRGYRNVRGGAGRGRQQEVYENFLFR